MKIVSIKDCSCNPHHRENPKDNSNDDMFRFEKQMNI